MPDSQSQIHILQFAILNFYLKHSQVSFHNLHGSIYNWFQFLYRFYTRSYAHLSLPAKFLFVLILVACKGRQTNLHKTTRNTPDMCRWTYVQISTGSGWGVGRGQGGIWWSWWSWWCIGFSSICSFWHKNFIAISRQNEQTLSWRYVPRGRPTYAMRPPAAFGAQELQAGQAVQAPSGSTLRNSRMIMMMCVSAPSKSCAGPALKN